MVRFTPLSAVLFAILSAASLPAFAQPAPAATTASQPVDVLGQRIRADEPRRDVSTVCPAVHAELPEALASAWHKVGTSGVVRMRFTLDGERVVAAKVYDGPRAYHRHLREAIYAVQCASDRSGRQVFELAVRFADPQELRAEGQRRVALLAD